MQRFIVGVIVVIGGSFYVAGLIAYLALAFSPLGIGLWVIRAFTTGTCSGRQMTVTCEPGFFQGYFEMIGGFSMAGLNPFFWPLLITSVVINLKLLQYMFLAGRHLLSSRPKD